jgi:hypothetical protein
LPRVRSSRVLFTQCLPASSLVKGAPGEGTRSSEQGPRGSSTSAPGCRAFRHSGFGHHRLSGTARSHS